MFRKSFITAVLIIICINIFNVNVFASGVNHGSADDQSLSDMMTTVPEEYNENIDANVMQGSMSAIDSTVGLAISVLLYLIFAGLGFTTACDLLYIAVPGLRPSMYSGSSGGMIGGFGGMQGGMQNGTSEKQICLVSSEIRSLVDNNCLTLKNYFKSRAVAITITVAILLLLVTTSVFTDFGLNIGRFVFDVFKNILAF